MGRVKIQKVAFGAAAALMASQMHASADQVIADDLIVQGSTCVGLDCVNNENFGFDTIILKENNTRIFFNDTSTSPGFPANDWAIEINDSASGGRSHFSIVDRTAGKTLLRLCAVADTNCTPILPGAGLDPQTAINTADIATNTANIASNTARIGSLEQTVGNLQEENQTNKEGVAMALAMGGGGLASDENYALNFNYGNFDGASAAAMFGSARLDDRWSLNGGIGYGFGNQSVGGRLGVRVGW